MNNQDKNKQQNTQNQTNATKENSQKVFWFI